MLLLTIECSFGSLRRAFLQAALTTISQNPGKATEADIRHVAYSLQNQEYALEFLANIVCDPDDGSGEDGWADVDEDADDEMVAEPSTSVESSAVGSTGAGVAQHVLEAFQNTNIGILVLAKCKPISILHMKLLLASTQTRQLCSSVTTVHTRAAGALTNIMAVHHPGAQAGE